MRVFRGILSAKLSLVLMIATVSGAIADETPATNTSTTSASQSETSSSTEPNTSLGVNILPKTGEPVGQGLGLGCIALGVAGAAFCRLKHDDAADRPTQAPDSAPLNSPAPACAATPTSILVVEDDEDIAALLTRILHDEGLVVTSAPSGQQALDRSRDRPPSLVLLDLELPDLPGEAVARTLRAVCGEALPIVVVSGAPDAAEVAERINAVTSLSKPFATSDVLAAVRRARADGRAG